MHQLIHLAGDLHSQRLALAGQQRPAQRLFALRRATRRAQRRIRSSARQARRLREIAMNPTAISGRCRARAQRRTPGAHPPPAAPRRAGAAAFRPQPRPPGWNKHPPPRPRCWPAVVAVTIHQVRAARQRATAAAA